MTEIRRAILKIVEPQRVRIDILQGGKVRLRVANEATQDRIADTLEEILLEAASHPALQNVTYEQLAWEIDMRGLRGE